MLKMPNVAYINIDGTLRVIKPVRKSLASSRRWLLLVLLWNVLLHRSASDETARLRAVAIATAPTGFASIGATVGPELEYSLLGLFSAAATHLLLGAWYVRRFGRISDLEIRSPRAAEAAMSRHDWLGPPRRSQISAVAWKQIRESGPIVLIGAVGIFGLVALFIAVTWREIAYRPKEIVEAFGGVTVAGGFLIALVVGIGAFLYDTGPQLNTFWRSRPINPHLWFWSKFVTGLMVVFAALYIPLVVIAWLMSLHTSEDLWHRDALMMPLLHVAIYAAAVAMTCLVRHAVYAAIFSVAALYLGLAAVWGAWRIAGMIGLVEHVPRQIGEMPQEQVMAGLLTTAVVSTLVAWLAVRNDWGWRHGRA